mmetsp:Transcript_945/g.2522  ORF Transcript_945/g.2522 Transcript_945/m.2522 type:complete len:213 (-) Transcript_945:106-744(-)
MMRPTRSITGRPSAALRLRSCSGRSVSLTNTAHGVASLAVPCLPLPPPPPPPLVAPPMPSLAKPQLALLLIAPLTALPRLPSALSLPLASVTPSPPAAAVLPAACGASAAAMRSRNSCIAPVPKNAGLPDRDTRLWPTVATPIGPPSLKASARRIASAASVRWRGCTINSGREPPASACHAASDECGSAAPCSRRMPTTSQERERTGAAARC